MQQMRACPAPAGAYVHYGEGMVGEDIFRKTDPRPTAIAHEVASLRWLADAGPGAARVVAVLDSGPTWIAEPRLRSIRPSAQDAEDFGRRLALTHAAGASHFGAPPAGFAARHGHIGGELLPLTRAGHDISSSRPANLGENAAGSGSGSLKLGAGSLKLEAGPGDAGAGATNSAATPAPPSASHRPSWGAFFAEYRIAPYIDRSPFTPSERATIEHLSELLKNGDFDHDQPALVEKAIARDPSIGAARIHGDLWSGNVLWTPEGAVLIDAAAHGGHAEDDLAALHLFGCAHLEHIMGAYNEVSPLAAGWRERIGLHQLHLLMVHCALFGRGYCAETVAIARKWAG